MFLRVFHIFKRKQKPYHITIPINNFQKNKKLANKIIFSKHLSKNFKYIKYQHLNINKILS